MTCTTCGRWAPADRETGFDADGLCRNCARREELSDMAASAEQDILAASDCLRGFLDQRMETDLVIEIYQHLTDLVRHLTDTQDRYGVAIDISVRR
jgi:hypothetical protein